MPSDKLPKHWISNTNLYRISDIVKLAYQSVHPEECATLTLVDFRQLLGAEHNISKFTLMQHGQQIQSAVSAVTYAISRRIICTVASWRRNALRVSRNLVQKEVIQLHCTFRHYSDKKLLLSLEKHNIQHHHLRKYISGLTCQACLLLLGHW
jgi:hypothetical protein